MTLATGTTYNSLPVCPKCGWPTAGPYETEKHHRQECELVRAIADWRNQTWRDRKGRP